MTEAVSSHSTSAPAVQARSLTSVNRRALITGAAALAVAAAPVAAQAAPVDQELLNLGRRYEAAQRAENAALALWDALEVNYEQAATPPAALLIAPGDHRLFRFLSPSARAPGDAYEPDDIARMRKPQTCPQWFLTEQSTGIRTDVASSRIEFDTAAFVLDRRSILAPDAQARADEILTAWDGHAEASRALRERLDLPAAEAAYYAALRVRRAIGDAIIDARATTLAGLAVRARIVSGMMEVDDEPDALSFDDRMMLAIVRDLSAMAPST